MSAIAKIPALALLLIAIHAETGPRAVPADRPRLYGIKKIAVTISADPDADLNRQRLQTAVESRLRSAGIRIDRGSRSHLAVVIGLSMIRSGEGMNLGFAYSIHLGLMQQVYLAHNPNRLTQAVTWETMSLGTSSADELAVRCERIIAWKMDEFVSVYLDGAEK
jgi:hypothetical protein